ncbi:unnamed protein product [Leptosia nina]|uniref:Peptidase S1 domain-containing protein n=1 Tax=Leptosia nina TaxID=320188 RepID=A0AAV1J1F3_9NEOP
MFLLYFALFRIVRSDSSDLSVTDIAKTLISILNNEENERIKELKDKLKDINKYVVDKDRHADLLLNEAATTNLNETNFFKALNESDNFNFLTDREPKHLYLKLKEKMNRDDIMKILSEKAENSQLVKAARRMMENDHGQKRVIDNDVIDNIVDKMIAETPRDDHKFNVSDNKYWDPQGELEDLKEYHKHDGRRIFKGERTTIKHYPFMVSIHVMGRFWCGGVIYWHDLVITSASCLQLMHNNRFFRENPKALYVRVGSNHSRIGGEAINALEVYFHPGYNPRTLRHNIAIVRLRRHLFFGYHRVPKVIDISQSAHGLAPTSEVLVLGWGVTKHDAGGPAVLAGKLVGIISFGPTVCGYPNVPTVFTLVGAYTDWIETVNETMPDYFRGRKRTTTIDPIPLFEDLQFSKLELNRFTSRETGATAPRTPTTSAANRLRNMALRHDEGWSIELD